MFISEILNENWKIIKKDFFFFFIILLIYILLSIGGTLILSKIISIQLIVQVIAILLTSWLSIGVTIISLKKVNGEESKIIDLFSGHPYLASYIGAYILYLIICLAGFILLIFPGIMWSIKFIFYPYLIVDKKLSSTDALRESAKLTEGCKWDILGFAIVTIILQIIGVLLLLIGIFWTEPLVWLSWASLYVKLKKIKETKNKE